jgi:uncharacterized coiled-coil protein SlyX
MESKLDDILESIKNIEKRIDNIEVKLNVIENDCVKMNNHVDFIQSTYKIIRKPLNYLTNKLEVLMGRNEIKLPEIK